MLKIYSKIQEGLLLHIVFKLEDFKEGRQDLIESENFIQCAALSFDKMKTFRPHRHKVKPGNHNDIIAQESWVIIKGRVLCTFYDIDDVLLEQIDLRAGDASFTLYGGHAYTVLSSNAKILEFKTGPYYGQSEDKVFID